MSEVERDRFIHKAAEILKIPYQVLASGELMSIEEMEVYVAILDMIEHPERDKANRLRVITDITQDHLRDRGLE